MNSHEAAREILRALSALAALAARTDSMVRVLLAQNARLRADVERLARRVEPNKSDPYLSCGTPG